MFLMETYERDTANRNSLRGNYFLGAEFMLTRCVQRKLASGAVETGPVIQGIIRNISAIKFTYFKFING